MVTEGATLEGHEGSWWASCSGHWADPHGHTVSKLLRLQGSPGIHVLRERHCSLCKVRAKHQEDASQAGALPPEHHSAVQSVSCITWKIISQEVLTHGRQPLLFFPFLSPLSVFATSLSLSYCPSLCPFSPLSRTPSTQTAEWGDCKLSVEPKNLR